VGEAQGGTAVGTGTRARAPMTWWWSHRRTWAVAGWSRPGPAEIGDAVMKGGGGWRSHDSTVKNAKSARKACGQSIPLPKCKKTGEGWKMRLRILWNGGDGWFIRSQDAVDCGGSTFLSRRRGLRGAPGQGRGRGGRARGPWRRCAPRRPGRRGPGPPPAPSPARATRTPRARRGRGEGGRSGCGGCWQRKAGITCTAITITRQPSTSCTSPRK